MNSESAAVSPGGARSSTGATALLACSACAGDYEDPDRTAWAPDELDSGADEDEREAARRGVTEEFPAEE